MSEGFRPDRTPLVAADAIQLHPPDFTAIFGGAVTLGAAQAALAEVGQWLAIDGDASQAIGHLILSNSTGPLRLGFGAWRDVLLGVQLRNGQGELISAGGQTMKNVAGYDLTKFIVGSEGMLGHIVTAAVRTYKLPTSAILARHRPDQSVFSRLISTPLRPQWAVLTSHDLFCGYLGDKRTIDFYMASLPRSEPIEITARTVADDMADRARLWQTGRPLGFRASVPPSRMGEASALLEPDSWAADPAFGIVLGSVNAESKMEAVNRSIRQVGGAVRWTRQEQTSQEYPGFEARPAAAIDFSTNPLEREIIERLKCAFDPDNRLTPLPWATT